MRRLLFILLLASFTFALPASAAEVLPPASERFAAADPEEVPSFQRHVVPLLGRLGCNGRACHGSFQGQGGFRLSLFGYDFQSDHGEVLKRISRDKPEASLILEKPTLAVDHDGGKRFAADSWHYNLILRWLRSGAPGHSEDDAPFVSVEVVPPELVFTKAGEIRQLRVTARWADGSAEDVTPLCRWRSNDESVAAVSESGLVTAAGKGDTAIVAFYDNGVAPVPVLLPISEKAFPNYPDVPTPTKIDELVAGKLRKLGIVPSELCTDAEFLRRVSLDMTGTLPAAEEVSTFLADQSPEKRTKKIDELLARPAYAAWWATRLCDVTGNSERNGPLGGEQALNREKAKQWYAWTYRRVADNMPYDQLVEGLVLAIGHQPGQTYEDYCSEMSSYFRKENPADFTSRPTMPYFWTRRALGKPEERALSFSFAFLGVSLQCAQCHKHPYDQWTKQDFDQFAAFFTAIKYNDGNKGLVQEMKSEVGLTGDQDSGAYKRQFVELLQQGKVLPFKNLSVPQRANTARKGGRPSAKFGRVFTPKLLGGEEVIASQYDDPRRPLMDWIRQEDNPYFARAFVNRVWAGYFHAGIIHPTDDMNLANPPSNAPLLDYLADEFVKHGYDMRWLHREIASSRTYQLSCRPNETNAGDERNFSRAVLRRMPAEAAYDAIHLATASDEALKALHSDPAGTRAIGAASCFAGRRDENSYAVNLFGKPPRAINCDCERSAEPSLLQTVYLRNDPELAKLLDRPEGWLNQISRSKSADRDELIRQAYLRTLSRLPQDKELAIARDHLSEAGKTASGLRDLLWALLNTKEFIVIR